MRRFCMMTLLGLLTLTFCGSANAQAPVAGQPYQIPAGYTGYGVGTSISYGGYNYVIQADGTMLLAQQSTTQAPVAGQPYQVPAGYTGYGAGTSISYGGYNYVIQADGTMLLAQQSGYSSYYSPPTYWQNTTPGYWQNTTPGYYWPGSGSGGYWQNNGPGYWPGSGSGGYWRTGIMGQPVFDPGFDRRTGNRILVD